MHNSPTATVWGTRNDDLKRLWLESRRQLRQQGWSRTAIKRELDRRRLGEWSQVGTYVGDNVMGKILMECRAALVTGTPLPIDHALLHSKNITLAGSEEKRQWTFENLWYNIPLDKIADSPWNQAKYLLLYVRGEKFVGNICKIVRTNHDVWTKEQLARQDYPGEPNNRSEERRVGKEC